MTKTIVATHAETNPKWKEWSKAAAHAENMIGTAQEARAWKRADALWAEWELWLEEQKAARLYRTAVIMPVKPIVPKSSSVISLPEDDYFGAMRP